jgi:hypothetical protein
MTNPNAARFGDLSPEEQAKWNSDFAKAQDNFALGASAMTQAFELPSAAAWREYDDPYWIYYDETNRPETAAHIASHQKDAHEVRVFAMFTAEQVRLCVDEALKKAVDDMQAAVVNGELPAQCEAAYDWLERYRARHPKGRRAVNVEGMK